MEPAFAQKLYKDPDKSTEDAISAPHNRFIHASELTWIENGQNLRAILRTGHSAQIVWHQSALFLTGFTKRLPMFYETS